MSELLAGLGELPLVTMNTGDYLMRQDEMSGKIYFLHTGAVQVVKDGYEVATTAEAGAVFGEMSVLLDRPHAASVICMEESSFHCIENPQQYLETYPTLLWHIARVLGLRLYNLDQYLVDVKRQYEGHDHLNMVDDVLETLLNQQATKPQQRGRSKRDTPDY